MTVRLKTLPDLLKTTLVDGLDIAIPEQGAALAFYAMLSLAPLLIFLLSIASAVFGTETARDYIDGLLDRFSDGSGAAGINHMLRAPFSHPQGHVVTTTLNAGMLLFGASGVFTQLQNVLNLIWKIPAPKRKFIGMLREHFLSLVIVLCAGLLLIATILIGTVVTTALHLATALLPETQKAAQAVVMLVNIAVIGFIFAVSYKMIPAVKIKWGDVWGGAALAACLFAAGQYVIGFYVAHTGFVAGYGAAGSLVALLVWIYYSAQIYFFGAQFTAVYARRFGSYRTIEQQTERRG